MASVIANFKILYQTSRMDIQQIFHHACKHIGDFAYFLFETFLQRSALFLNLSAKSSGFSILFKHVLVVLVSAISSLI